MRRYYVPVYLVLAVLLLFPVSARAINVQEHILDNGLKVLILEEHKAPTATFQVWYRVGSRDENIGKTGLSHLLEHMMFKGTREHGPKTFSQSIQRAGGTDNAFTTAEYTAYFEMLASDRLDLPIELEADRMRNLMLTDDAVLSERDVVMEERRLRYDDDPQNLLLEQVVATAFQNHPYRWPVIGWMSDLKTLNPEDLRRHYATYYEPNNAVIVVVGDVNPVQILSKIRKAFGKIPKGPEIRETKASEDPQYGEKRIIVRKEAELPEVLIAYKAPAISQEDGPALDVLGSILSEGKSTRIYNALVYEKQLALSAGAGYDGMHRDPHLFFAEATAARGRDIGDVEKALIEEIEKIRQQPPSESEVQKAKNQVEASFIMEQDSFYMQARLIGTFEMIGGWRLIDSYLDGIRKVTAGDVLRVARKYLVPGGKTTGVLIPLEAKK
ncbi:MAG: pitrilysin family protein [Nitrospiraceae bacterium]|nr:pitrilysin family protein [Nitrospiraceae bacterium]